MSLLLASIAAGAVASGEPLSFVAQVEVDREIVRLADVADLSALPEGLRERAAASPVARLRFADQTLSSQVMAQRARASIPALAAWLPAEADRPVRVRWIRAEPAAPVPVATPPPPPAIKAGDQLAVVVNVGPVVVERDVRALQPGRAGDAIFVRTPEGVVLRARLAGDQ